MFFLNSSSEAESERLELDQDEERVWEDLAEFQEGDVHHQYAIVFKTPK